MGYASDKLGEAEFFLDHAAKAKGSGREYRYFLSASVTAARSVTFALQAELRPKHGAEFDAWYERRAKQLARNKFARAVLNLRNVFQKQGNRLTYQFEHKLPGCTVKVFLRPDGSMDLAWRKTRGIIRGNEEDVMPRVWDWILQDLIPQLATSKPGPPSIVFEGAGRSLSKPAMLAKLRIHLGRLRKIVDEANKRFPQRETPLTKILRGPLRPERS